MNLLTGLLHAAHFCLPALGLAALLTPALVRWRGVSLRRSAALWRSLLWGWALLSALGVAVWLFGLWWLGADGRMASYGMLVLALGTAVAVWRSR